MSKFRVIYSSCLKHHGIQGQRWGIRNGPPYPLSKETHSSVINKHRGVVDEVVLPLAVTAAIPIMTYVIPEYRHARKWRKLESEYESGLNKKREGQLIDGSTGLHLKDMSKHYDDDILEVNPKAKTDDKTGAVNNCVLCTMAYEFRRRGYDVSAKLSEDGMSAGDVVKDLFPGCKSRVFPKPYNSITENDTTYLELMAASPNGNRALAQNAISNIKKEGPSRGQLAVLWNSYGGHSMVYEVTKDGDLKLIDSQSGFILEGKAVEDLLAHTCTIEYERLDNVLANPSKARRYMV